VPRPSRRVFVAATAACSALPRAAAAQTLEKLTVGAAPIDSGMTSVVALRGGFYRRYNLDVEIVESNSGAAHAAAVVGGALQVGASSLMGLLTAHLKGIPFQIVSPAAMYFKGKPSDLLIVRKDSPIQTAADCNGKTIASPALHDLLATTSMAWIDQNGGDSKTVRQVELPPAATPAALDAGRIDVAALAEPRLSEILNSGSARVLGNPYDVIAPRFLISAFFALPETIAAHRDAIIRMARAHHDANIWANAHPDQTAPWLADLTKTDVAAILHAKRAQLAETLSVTDIQPLIDAAARYKVIDHAFNATEMVSPVVINLHL